MFDREGPSFKDLVVQALSSTEHGYDLIAEKFDHTPFRTPEPLLDAMAKVMGEPKSIDSALDVCCGTGAALYHLRALCKTRAVGLDFSDGMLAQAKKRAESAPGDAKIELVRGDALAMPFENEFDVVTSVGAFGHILREDEDKFVAGIARALKKGGRFVFITSFPPPAGSKWWIVAHGFNAVMRVRNAILEPQFIMYYLTFLWPEVGAVLERNGFAVKAHTDVCPAPFQRLVVVEATKK